jgi:GLPGLI family protein
MKKFLIAGLMLHFAGISICQVNQGKVIYERTSQMQVRLSDDGDEMERVLPKTRNEKFELTFGKNQSLWKEAEQESEDNDDVNSGGMQLRMIMIGSEDVLFSDFNARKTVELRVMFEKKFIVDDSIRQLKWKMSDETKTILNHLCRKATAVNYRKRMMMNVDNGKVEKKEVNDTSNVVAWFTTDFPVSAGPAEYQGQLPGLILEMDISNGRQVFHALDISDKADMATIKEPQGKKHYSPAEFNKERDKMMEEMEKNNSGGNRTIRIN